MSDGLTVSFALAAGLSGAVHANLLVITAQPPLQGALKVTLIGIAAAAAAFGVAKIVSGMM